MSIIAAAAPLVPVATAWALFGQRITVSTVAHAGLSVSVSAPLVVAAMVLRRVYHSLQRPLRRHTGLEVGTDNAITNAEAQPRRP